MIFSLKNEDLSYKAFQAPAGTKNPPENRRFSGGFGLLI